jgi:hypothetical protein
MKTEVEGKKRFIRDRHAPLTGIAGRIPLTPELLVQK